MNEFVLRSPRRVIIDSAGKWRELVLPQQWGRGKPLTELAERWTTSTLPEVDVLLASQPATCQFSAEEGWVGLPELDVLLSGQAAGGSTLLAALAVAESPLGPSVGEALRVEDQRKRMRGMESSVDLMAERVFSVEASVLKELNHRLLAVSAALLTQAKARNSAQAVLVVHELRSPYTPRQLAADQLAAVDEFVLCLSHRSASLAQAGTLAGPFAGGLYIGRALFQR